jgi:hypothetical protein
MPAIGGLGRVSTHKSLAPYRECRGENPRRAEENSGRGTFDRGDLKEAVGGAGRAMEPLAFSWGFGAGNVGNFAPREAGKAAFGALEEVGMWR